MDSPNRGQGRKYRPKFTLIFFVRRAVEGVRVLKTLWKHHKSKEHIFLHRSYTPFFFNFEKKIFFSVDQKKIENFSTKKKSRKKIGQIFWSKFSTIEISEKKYFPRKFPKFFQICKIPESLRIWVPAWSDFFFESVKIQHQPQNPTHVFWSEIFNYVPFHTVAGSVSMVPS